LLAVLVPFFLVGALTTALLFFVVASLFFVLMEMDDGAVVFLAGLVFFCAASAETRIIFA
jgi:hypothetical protein